MTELPDNLAERAKPSGRLRQAREWIIWVIAMTGLVIAVRTDMFAQSRTAMFGPSKKLPQLCFDQGDDFPSPSGRYIARVALILCSYGKKERINPQVMRVALRAPSESHMGGHDIFVWTPINGLPSHGQTSVMWDGDKHIIITLHDAVNIHGSETEFDGVRISYRATFDYSIEHFRELETEYDQEKAIATEEFARNSKDKAAATEYYSKIYREDLRILRLLHQQFREWAVHNIVP
jgi:hypothetical protein